MLVQKLFSSEHKSIVQKPKFQKPVYKSYKQLLHLDRPRKKISFQSSDEEEDFLEKLLNQQKQKAKDKKKKSRKSTPKIQPKPKIQRPQSIKTGKGTSKKQSEQNKPKQTNKVMSEIEMFLAQAKAAQNQGNLQDEIKNQQQIKSNPPKTAKSKSSTNLKVYPKIDKSKILRQDILLKNPIFIDNKSIETPPIFHTSADKLFNTTVKTKHELQAYKQLLREKIDYQQTYRRQSEVNLNLMDEQIQHKIQANLTSNFSFAPNIEPVSQNWRLNLTFNPLDGKCKREFADRRQLFKSSEQQYRFLSSLRDFSSLRR